MICLVASHEAGAGTARVVSRGPVQLNLAFRRFGTAEFLLARDPFVFAGAGDGGTLIDTRSGRRTTIVRPGCRAVTIGGPWLAFACGVATPQSPAVPELYSLRTGRWRRVALAPRLATQCTTSDFTCGVGLTRVGADWLKFAITTCYHCSRFNLFQNLTTGQIVGDPTSASVIPDLNRASLATKVCSPLRVPYSTGDVYDNRPTPGDLSFEGRYAIAAFYSNKDIYSTYLERCGSHLHQLICRAVTDPNCSVQAATARMIVWQAGPSTLDGIYLPSRRRFSAHLPSTLNLQDLSELALTGGTLFLATESGQIYTATLPAAP